MRTFLDKFFLRSNNLENISQSLKSLSKQNSVSKIFDAINSFSNSSEVRYVGGCVRKAINKEIIEDIDLAFKLTFFNKCDEMERPILSEYYQRCFGRELIKVEKSIDA